MTSPPPTTSSGSLSGHVAQLASFVPLDLARRLAEAAGGPVSGDTQLAGSVLVADLAGFTRLTERLIEREGVDGTERLSRLLNGFFERIIDLVAEAGGEVTTFAGDALIALFQAEGGATSALGSAARASAACGLAIRDTVAGIGTIEGVEIDVRVGVGAGPMVAARVGGRRDRWEVVLSGSPIRQVARTLERTESGNVGLSDEAWALCVDDVVGFNVAVGVHRLDRLLHLPVGQVRPRAKAGAADEPILRGIVPGVVRVHLEDGAANWLATLRRLSVLFVRIDGLDAGSAGATALNDAVREIQRILYYHGGSLAKVLADDKGTMVLAAFGLPRETFEYRVDYALAAAMSLGPALRGFDLECAVGIATGTVFCGPIGSESRREYTLIGSTVNLAARLCAKAGYSVLCDDATRSAARLEVRFEERRTLALKGFDQSVRNFAPVGMVDLAPAARSGRLALAGREREVAILDRTVGSLVAEDRSGLVRVVAEPGTGKSRLLAEVARLCTERGLDHLAARCDRLATDTSYRCWRRIFRRILGLSSDLGSATRPRHAAAPGVRGPAGHRRRRREGAPGLPGQPPPGHHSGDVRACGRDARRESRPSRVGIVHGAAHGRRGDRSAGAGLRRHPVDGPQLAGVARERAGERHSAAGGGGQSTGRGARRRPGCHHGTSGRRGYRARPAGPGGDAPVRTPGHRGPRARRSRRSVDP